jgi:hypothetical protein
VPALERGLVRSGRTRADLEIAFPAMVIVADNDKELDEGRNAMRPRLAFYGSTPAYKVVLEAHGWGDLQEELNRLSKVGDWGTMSAMITDEIVDTFVTSGTTDTIASRVIERYGDIVERVSFDASGRLTPDRVATIIAGFR